MFEPEAIHNVVEWRQARPEDAAIWVSVTRRSADQLHFEPEDAQIARYKEESAAMQAQRYLLWRGDTPSGAYVFFHKAMLLSWMALCSCLMQVVAWPLW